MAASVLLPAMAISDHIKAGAPADEIEITPEMIEAGTLALSKHDEEFESSDEAVVRIFRAMLEALLNDGGVSKDEKG
jgi:hypothetical protein